MTKLKKRVITRACSDTSEKYNEACLTGTQVICVFDVTRLPLPHTRDRNDGDRFSIMY